MQLASVFRTSVYVMLNLSAIMLMLSEGAAFPQLLSIPISLIALFFTDRSGSIRFSPFWTNVTALGLVGLAFSELVYGEVNENIEARILSGAHLLVYLTWVVMLQEKRFKQYWWLCALSVLQVAVGAVLTKAGWYGGLLFVYFFLSIWTLSVFSMYRASESMSPESTITSGPPGAEPAVVGAESRMLLPATAASAGDPRQFNRSSSASMRTIQMDMGEHWISRRFVGGTLMTALGAIFIGSLFFVAIPRIWIGRPPFANSEEVEAGRTLTGFTSEVRLGAFGEILESTQQVLEIRVFDGDRELDVSQYATRLGFDEPLFRGTVLGVYNSGGRWSVGSLGGRLRQIKPRPSRGSAIRQEIVLEPIGTDCLFAMHPVLACNIEEEPGRARVHSSSNVLFQTSTQVNKRPTKYTVYSPRQSSMPINGRVDDYALYVYKRLPPRLNRLKQLARDVAYAGDQVEPSDVLKADRLEKYLRDSGEFTYTLRMERIDADLDPVEDFLFNRKQGHCEYYASSLALMLRAVGIPSRLISGFKGGIENSVTGRFEVQQRHAHAWVEAYVDGAWQVMDATPAERAETVQALEPRLKTWADLKRLISDLWSNQIVDVSLQNQYRNVYRPMQQSASQWWSALSGNREDAKALWQTIREFASSPDKWFSWQGGLVTFILSFLLCGCVWGTRKLWRVFRKLRAAWADPMASRRRVEFYEQFRQICAAQGITRAASQSHWEFADQARCELGESLAASDAQDLPSRVVEAFLAIRFGEQLPTTEQLATLKSDVLAFGAFLTEQKRESDE